MLAVSIGTYVGARVRGAPFWQATIVLVLMTWATLALDDFGYLKPDDKP